MVIASLLLVVAGLALITAMGGWARTTPDGPQAVAPGTEVEATPFRVSLDSAAATYEAAGREAEPGQAILVVDGELSLETSESVGGGTLEDAFFAELPHGYSAFGAETANPSPQVKVAVDGSLLNGLGPGLTYDVQLTFTVDETDVPDRMTVVVLEHLRRRSFLDDSLCWCDPAAAARVSLDVAPLPAERPAPEGF